MEVVHDSNGKDTLEKLRLYHVNSDFSDIFNPIIDEIRLLRAVRSMMAKARPSFLAVESFDDCKSVEASRDPGYEGFVRKAPQFRFSGNESSADNPRRDSLATDPSERPLRN